MENATKHAEPQPSASFRNPACSSEQLNPIGWREAHKYLVFLLPVSTHFHSAARVTSSTHTHRSRKGLRRGRVSPNNNNPKPELQHSNKNTKQKKRKGVEGEKTCSGIKPTVASRQLSKPLASASSFKRAVISKLLSRFYRTPLLI